jgi:hypothetical protein
LLHTKTGGTFDNATSPACHILAIYLASASLPGAGKKVMDTPTHAPADRGQTDSGEWSLILQGRTGCTQNTQTDIVVTVVCVVPVAGGRAREHRIVVPRTAPRHTTRSAFFPLLNIGWIGSGSKGIPKIGANKSVAPPLRLRRYPSPQPRTQPIRVVPQGARG